MSAPIGVLLVNLGTPDSPGTRDVRRYLREFLSDPLVIDLPAPLRWLLLHAVILPFRPGRSARAYRAIWTEQGSPLLVHSRSFATALAKDLGGDYHVELAMRYGRPSLGPALERLQATGVERLIVVPLFPQQAAPSSGSAALHVRAGVERTKGLPEPEILGPFFDDPAYVAVLAEGTQAALDTFEPDHLLMSFHGLPVRQILATDPTGRHCLASENCCLGGEAVRWCYRAQCLSTARALASALGLPDERSSIAFQSRLGRTAWIRPYLDDRLVELATAGVRRLAVVCPSFVADCLESLEEIGIRGRERWLGLGGQDFHLVPCPNAQPAWVSAVADRIRTPA
ncbi:MAG: ferrochelatase [Myxococcota bacterium]